jgi:acetyl-CoA carboxylase, biotin carboxylase subunit
MVTGLDLVKLQIRVAARERLPFLQQDILFSGHAIECRLYAEDPDNNFFPSPGAIVSRRAPGGPGIRLDDGVYAGFMVSTEYDPLLGKLISWGGDRAEAIARLKRALAEYAITGIKTNVSLFRNILRDPQFIRGEIFTRWLDERLPDFSGPRKKSAYDDPGAEDAAILAALLHHLAANGAASVSSPATQPESRWKREARLEQVDRSQ